MIVLGPNSIVVFPFKDVVGVAQPAERVVVDHEAASSNLVAHPKLRLTFADEEDGREADEITDVHPRDLRHLMCAETGCDYVWYIRSMRCWRCWRSRCR